MIVVDLERAVREALYLVLIQSIDMPASLGNGNPQLREGVDLHEAVAQGVRVHRPCGAIREIRDALRPRLRLGALKRCKAEAAEISAQPGNGVAVARTRRRRGTRIVAEP